MSGPLGYAAGELHRATCDAIDLVDVGEVSDVDLARAKRARCACAPSRILVDAVTGGAAYRVRPTFGARP